MKKFGAVCLCLALLCLFGCGQVPVPSVYPASELDPILGPGPFTINELVECFGEPGDIGIFQPHTGLPYKPFLFLKFENIEFDFFGFHYDYDLEEVNRSRLMELYRTIITDGNFPLPRGIRIGDSIEKIRTAYPDPPGRETAGYEDGELNLFYRYLNKEDEAKYQEGDLYYAANGIYYLFHEDILTQATIAWSKALPL